jgi:hypothetical protein
MLAPERPGVGIRLRLHVFKHPASGLPEKIVAVARFEVSRRADLVYEVRAWRGALRHSRWWAGDGAVPSTREALPCPQLLLFARIDGSELDELERIASNGDDGGGAKETGDPTRAALRVQFAQWLAKIRSPGPALVRTVAEPPRVFALERLPSMTASRRIRSLASATLPGAAGPLNPLIGEALKLCGLWTAPYGGHGIEVLHVTIEEGDDGETIEMPTSSAIEGGWCLSDSSATLEQISNAIASAHEWPRSYVRPDIAVGTYSATSSVEGTLFNRSVRDEDKDDEVAFRRSQVAARADAISNGAQQSDVSPFILAAKRSAAAPRLPLVPAPVERTAWSPLPIQRSTPFMPWWAGLATHVPSHEVASSPSLSCFYAPSARRALGATSSPDSARTLRATPLRLVGRKVIGDVNVPSGHYSFAVDLSYEAFVPHEHAIPPVPVLMFGVNGAGGGRVVNLAAEPITAAFAGVGFINRLPSRFLSETMRATLFVLKSSSTLGGGAIGAPNSSERHAALCWLDPDDISHLTPFTRISSWPLPPS